MKEDTLSSTHPQLPPTTEEERVSWLRLLRSRRVGISTFNRLMAEHGSAAAALSALPEIARGAGVDNYDPCPEAVILAELKAGQATGARLVARGEVLPVPPAKFDPPGAYTHELSVKIGVNESRGNYGQYIENTTERKLHGREG